MTKHYTPTSRQAETTESLANSIRSYDDQRLAALLDETAQKVNDSLGLIDRAAAIVAAERLRQAHAVSLDNVVIFDPD